MSDRYRSVRQRLDGLPQPGEPDLNDVWPDGCWCVIDNEASDETQPVVCFAASEEAGDRIAYALNVTYAHAAE